MKRIRTRSMMHNVVKPDTAEKDTDRIVWQETGDEDGPVLIIFAGLHGNEPAGVRAVESFAERFEHDRRDLKGSVYAIRGNIKALEKGIRFLDKDLNRLWELNYNDNVRAGQKNGRPAAEYEELEAIKRAIGHIIQKHEVETDELVFIDLHTTSSNSCAFIPFNDTLKNRRLARLFPVPQILGIEEFVHGTLLSYINNLGFMAIGFEAGAHTDRESVRRCEAFLWLTLHYCDMISLSAGEAAECEDILDSRRFAPGTYYEIIHHHYVEDPLKFEMLKGFKNFDKISRGQPVARENGNLILSPSNGRIFMPLYQDVGHDGYFIIREISPVWLELSAYLRKSPLHNVLKYLPGVRQVDRGNFEIDLRTAKFLVRQLFHLLGYRVIRVDEHTMFCYSR